MTKREIAELMTIMQANYPDSFRGMSDSVVGAKIALWHDVFKDYPKEVVQAAAKSFMVTDTKGFMPNVGQIMEHIQRMKRREEMTPAEAWAIVSKALKNSTYGAEEEFESLPPDIQCFVGSPNQLREWALMEAETVQSVIGSNFQRSFRIRQAHDRDMEKLPGDVRKFIAGYAANIGRLESGEGEQHGDV